MFYFVDQHGTVRTKFYTVACWNLELCKFLDTIWLAVYKMGLLLAKPTFMLVGFHPISDQNIGWLSWVENEIITLCE